MLTDAQETYPFQADVDATVKECEQRMSAYGSALQPTIRSCYVRAIEATSAVPSLTFVLPFALGDAFGLARTVYRHVALASFLGLLHMTVQDDVMDQDQGGSHDALVPLATRLWTDSLHQFQTLMEASSSFWTLMEKYLGEWTDGVLWEREHHWNRAEDFQPADLINLAAKSAPLKIPCAAIALLAQRQETIPFLEAMVDCQMVGVQLLDDLLDWREDWSHGNFTYFLVRVAATQNVNVMTLTETDVHKAILIGAVVDETLDWVAEFSRRAREHVAALALPHLDNMIRLQEQTSQQIKTDCQARRARWIQEQWGARLETLAYRGAPTSRK